ncbi:hypothetical protein ACLOJK_021408 [Asimina triloba]
MAAGSEIEAHDVTGERILLLPAKISKKKSGNLFSAASSQQRTIKSGETQPKNRQSTAEASAPISAESTESSFLPKITAAMAARKKSETGSSIFNHVRQQARRPIGEMQQREERDGGGAGAEDDEGTELEEKSN